MRFASDDVPRLVKRALFAHWKYERRRRTKRRQVQINREPNKRRRRRKTSAAGGKSKRRRPRNQHTRRFGAQKSTGQCGEKIEPCFCEGKLRGSTFGSLPKNEGVRLLCPHLCRPRGICGTKPPAGAARAAGGMLPACTAARQQCKARRRSQSFFWGAACLGRAWMPSGACWASKLPPVF